MKSKFLFLLTSVFCVSILLFGVSGAFAKDTFTFWTWGNPGFFQDGFERMQVAYPQYKVVESTFFVAGGDTEELIQKLLVGWVAEAWDSLPDVCECPTPYIPMFADEGVIVDLTDYITPYADKLAPSTLAGISRGDRIVACPFSPGTSMLWYRKDITDTAAVDMEAIETWDDYIDAGKKITASGERYMLALHVTYPNDILIQLMLGQQGGAGFFDPLTGETVVDTSPAMKKTFEIIAKMGEEGIALRTDGWESEWYAALENGTLVTYPSANWWDQEMKFDVAESEGKWRAMQIPAIEPGGCRGGLESGIASVVAMAKPGINMDLIWAFMEHSFLNAEIAMELDKVWALSPAYLPAFENSYYDEGDPYYGGQNIKKLDLETQKIAGCMQYTADWGEVMYEYMYIAQMQVLGGRSVEEALKEAADLIRENIGTSF